MPTNFYCVFYIPTVQSISFTFMSNVYSKPRLAHEFGAFNTYEESEKFVRNNQRNGYEKYLITNFLTEILIMDFFLDSLFARRNSSLFSNTFRGATLQTHNSQRDVYEDILNSSMHDAYVNKKPEEFKTDFSSTEKSKKLPEDLKIANLDFEYKTEQDKKEKKNGEPFIKDLITLDETKLLKENKDKKFALVPTYNNNIYNAYTEESFKEMAKQYPQDPVTKKPFKEMEQDIVYLTLGQLLQQLKLIPEEKSNKNVNSFFKSENSQEETSKSQVSMGFNSSN